MKTTLDLPSDLVDELQLHAATIGVPLDNAAAELLRTGLAISVPPPVPSGRRPVITPHPVTGLPIIQCSSDAPARRMTVAELIALEQETQTQEDLERLGVPHRQ